MLSESTSRKSIALLGHLEGADADTKTIVYLEKKPFVSEAIADALSSEPTPLTRDFNNAEYTVYSMGGAAGGLGAVKCDVIHPATAKHVVKYTKHEVRVVRETAEMYAKVTLPYIEREELGDRIKWVHNILDKKKESERIMLEDTDPKDGFIFLPDMKWDQETTSDLYCQAIANRRDLPTLRSLTSEHLPLLRNILKKGCGVLESKFGLKSHHVRVYVHYQPSFYHLHVHFAHVDTEGSIECGKAHLLQNVIDNIELRGDYYQTVPLTMTLRTSLGLWKAYESAGCLPVEG